MTKTLLDRARVDLETASYLLQQDDDCHVDMAEYHTQQAIEKLLKEFISCCGVTPKRTHDISQLYFTAKGLGLELPSSLDSTLLLCASTLTEAEATSRYASSYLTIRKNVEIEYKLAKDLFQFMFPDESTSGGLDRMTI